METPAIISKPAGITSHHHHRSEDQIAISRLLRQKPNLPLPHLKQVHARLFRLDLHDDNILAAKLVSVCSTAGAVSYASRIFYSLRSPDLVLRNAMLKAYTLKSLPHQCLLFFLDQVLLSRLFLLPDCFTYPYVLRACSALRDSWVGAQLHGGIAKRTELYRDGFVMNSLADMYFKCGSKEMAVRVLKEVKDADAATWNIMLSGLVGAGDMEGAMYLFDGMRDKDVVSWNTMLSALARVGKMDVARRLFDQMPERNLVSWNGLIAGYSQNGQNEGALSVFSMMLREGVEPDGSTISSVASAACRLAEKPDGDVVEQIARHARTVNSVSVTTALLSLYARVGRLEEARRLFDGIPEKDLVAWNAMIGGYSQNQRPSEAIDLFRLMQRQERVKPDSISMASLVDSCSQMGALCLGEWIHAYIRKNKLKMDTFLVTALVDMYAKCGDLSRARRLFSNLDKRDLASWNAMIQGLAVHGQGREALDLFSLMENDGTAPNEITFIALLNGCSHGGLVEEGLELFDEMQTRYGVVPRMEHYGCVVDLLGRAGRLKEAFEFVENMPLEPDTVAWSALLSACRSHGNLELAEKAATKLIELEPGHDGNYVLLSNAYATAGKWADVEKVRARMRASKVKKKEPGCSSVEWDGETHEFRAGDRSHPRAAEIYRAWDELVPQLKAMGYEPDARAILKNVDEEEREEALGGHSEKLALSFALISTTGGNTKTTTIRIVKNLRICSDCHRAMELVSQLKRREIVVRDRKRFHHFSAGRCSCGGYW